MSDHTPPPERELDEETRARLRTQLTAGTGQPTDNRGVAPRWLIPAVAAAAVVAIAIGGVALLSHGPDQDAGGPAQPLGSGTASDPTGKPSAGEQVKPAPGADEDPVDSAAACDQELTQYLHGADEVSSIDYAAGTTYLYANGTKWVVCDDWAMGDGGPPTLIGDQRLDAAPSKDTFALSMNFVPDDKGLASEYFSGGPRIDGVTKIAYTFPGGDVVQATMNDEMWSMVYLPTKGLMAKNRLPQEPAVVTVTHDDGSEDSYEFQPFEWCAQLNHGC